VSSRAPWLHSLHEQGHGMENMFPVTDTVLVEIGSNGESADATSPLQKSATKQGNDLYCLLYGTSSGLQILTCVWVGN
jgi:hypothetical protein